MLHHIQGAKADNSRVRKNIAVYNSPANVEYYTRFDTLFSPELTIVSEIQHMQPKVDILEIGVGGGRISKLLVEHVGNYVGIDAAQGMVESTRKRLGEAVELHCMDARDLSQFKTACFDIVLWLYNGMDTLDHSGRTKTLNEIHRIIKKNGSFIFSSHNAAIIPYLFTENIIDCNIEILKHYSNSEIETRIMKNKDYRSFFNKPYAFFIDGCRNFELYTYYIMPDEQERQLRRHGFSLSKLYSLETGCETSIDSALSSKDEEWVYYWASAV